MSEHELPVSDLLAARRVADAGPDFWNDLEAQLATEPAPSGEATTVAPADDVDTELGSGGTELDEVQRRRVRRWLIAAATAAAIVAIVFGLNALTEDTAPTPVITDVTTTTAAATTATSTTTTEAITPPTIQAVAPESFGLPLIKVASDVTIVDNSDNDVGQRFGAATNGVAAFSGSQFVIIDQDGRTRRVDSPTSQPGDFVEAEDAVWVSWRQSTASESLVLQRVDINTGERTDISSYPHPGIMRGPSLHVDDDAIWAFYYDFSAAPAGIGAEQIDARSGEVLARFNLDDERSSFGGEQFAVGAGSLWEAAGQSLRRYDPQNGQLTAEIDIQPAQRLRGIIAHTDAVWAVTDRAIVRIDPATNEIAATINPPDFFQGFAGAAVASDAALFVSPMDDGPPNTSPALYRIDTNTNEIDAVIDLGASSPQPWEAVISGNTLWFGGDPLARVPLNALLQPAGDG